MMAKIYSGPNDKANNFRNIEMQQPIDQEVLAKVTGTMPAGVKFVDAKNHNKMGKDEFLKLLAFQLQNQDPMSPLDQNKFAGDLAQFSQLEQLANMNKTLESGQKNAPEEHKFYAASFLGKSVMTSGTTLKVTDDTGNLNIPFKLDRPAKNAIIRILDEKGQMTAQIERENLPAGPQSLSWNKMGINGQLVGNGNYAVDIFAWDDAMQMFKGQTQSEGVVKAVGFENGETVFTLADDKRVFLRDVETFASVSDTVTKPKVEQASKAYGQQQQLQLQPTN